MNSKLWSDSPLMRSERMLHAAMLALASMCLIGCYVLRCSIAESVDNITVKKDECKNLCELELELTSSIAKAKGEIEQLENEYHSALARIPRKIVDSELLSSVRGVAQTSHCNLLNFRPTETQSQPDFQTRSFELHIEGKFKDLYQFFDAMSGIPYVYHVRRFKISEPTIAGGACKIDLELKVVFNHVWSKSEKTL
jgi:Tfp pilus assembly protein PilO